MATVATNKQNTHEPALDERTMAVVGFGMPFNEVLGHPRDFLVVNLPRRLAPSMKGGRIAVRVRPESRS